jgi:glycosyltransferase involved in cell wall biosynthesis
MTNKVSLIVTVLNEADNIKLLLEAITSQTRLPDEVIMVDGGSIDGTVRIIKKYLKKEADRNPKIKKLLTNNFLIKKLPGSNRSIARNWAISNAKHPLIAITDAGCVPRPDWLEELYKTYEKTESPIVGGFFFGLPLTPFEQAVVAYTLQMPDRVNPNRFIPTTRSVMITKEIWGRLGGFDEDLSANEDFPFFFFARLDKVDIAFNQDAVVGWIPRRNFNEFIRMIYAFARGDIEAGIVRSRVQLLFGRYILVLGAVLFLVIARGTPIPQLLPVLAFWLSVYLLWAIWKNVRYVPKGWYWLPILQLTADLTVMTGSIMGLVNRYRYQPQVQ